MTSRNENERLSDIGLSDSAENYNSWKTELHPLEKIDSIYIKKGIRIGLARTEVDTTVYNDKNEKLCYVKELREDGCSGCCYTPNAWFDMRMFDLLDKEILHLSRDLQCWQFNRAPSVLEVFSSSNCKIGTCRAVFGFWRIKYNIEDESGNCILKIHSFWGFPYARFKILSTDKSIVLGKIIRQAAEGNSLLSRNYAYSVKITFPPDLDVKIKATLLSISLALMSAYFER